MATEATATEARGNTKARAFQLTLNQPERIDELIANMKSYKSLRYMIVGHLELAPKTGHQHYHVYVNFNVPIKLSLKKCCGAHIEIARGSPKQNIEYLTKEGEPYLEFGERPRQGMITIADLKEMTLDETPAQYSRMKTELDRKKKDESDFFSMLDEIQNDNLKAPKIIYITGGTGKGKTYSAYKKALSEYPKTDIGKITLKNDFFDVINENAKCFVIEEFRPSQIKASDFLQLTDKYGYRANIKGGFVSLRPEMIIICSIIPLDQIYKEEINKQFTRRVTEIINLDLPDADTM